VIPGKVADQVAILDASGRVSLIDESGAVARVYDFNPEIPISANVGGEAHLVALKKHLVAIWANQGFAIDIDTGEIASFDIEDGPPTSAVAWKGKLALGYRDQLILYDTNGFRYGDILMGSLGRGFESFDVTLDERGRLWAVTDQGRVLKFKKPGKVEFEIQVSDYSLQVPRIAVQDDMVFVTSRGQIIKADAREIHARNLLAREENAP
jgi:hypothetical protein